VAFLFPLALEEVEVVDEAVEETREMFFVVTECAQQREDAEATLARNARACRDVLARLLFDVEFQPLTAVRVDGALHQLVLRQVAQTEPLARFENDTR